MKIYSKTRYVVVAVLGMLFLAKGYVEGQGMTDSQRLGANCNIICAASDTPDELKACATFVCGEVDARPILQKAIDEASRLRVKCILLKGTYCINSRGENNPCGGVVFYSHSPKRGGYAHNQGCFQTLEGSVEPLGWLDGAVITMGEDLYDSISDDETFSMFYADGGSLFSRAWSISNLAVRLPGNQKPIVVFDGRFCSALSYRNLWISSVDPQSFDFASAKGIPVPHPRSVALRGTAGSNFYCRNEWKNCSVIGFGIGFDIGGEHVYCESLAALYNIYGFAFNCYKGKNRITDGDDLKSGPWGCFYPITCLNLLDEHNVNLPRFGNAGWPSHCQPITIKGMNIQWPNTCPGKTDCTAPDFLEGRCRATEDKPGSWHGSIEYLMDSPDKNHATHLVDLPFFEAGHGIRIHAANLMF